MQIIEFMQFDDAVETALRAMQFEIADDGETADISGTGVDIVEPERGVFQLTVILPNGTQLCAELSRAL